MALPLTTTPASAAWKALLDVVSEVTGRLAQEMESEVGMTLNRYGILLTLSQAGDGGLRPSELADVLPITASGVTRLVDRFEADGLVERHTCDTDGRGNVVTLTATGEQAFRTAGRVHLRGIQEHVGTHLDRDELADLDRILTKLLSQLGGDGAPADRTRAGRRSFLGRAGAGDPV